MSALPDDRAPTHELFEIAAQLGRVLQWGNSKLWPSGLLTYDRRLRYMVHSWMLGSRGAGLCILQNAHIAETMQM